MLKKYKIIIVFLLPLLGLAQVNLVPNPSFEIYTNCPTGWSQLDFAFPWFQPGTGTPDFFTSCTTNSDVGTPINNFGNQVAHTGNNYSGLQCMCAEYREYIEVALTNSLTAGTKYYVSFYVSMADTFAYTASSIGAYLSTGSLSVNHYSVIPVSPQIQNTPNNYFSSSNWKKISASFSAIGGENHITIGNFNTTANSNSLIVNTNTLVYNPNCVYFYIDDVCVTTDSTYNETWTNIAILEANKTSSINLYPNPVSDNLNIGKVNFKSDLNISIYSSNMSLIMECFNFKENSLDISSFPLGAYIVKIWNKDFITNKLIIKNH